MKPASSFRVLPVAVWLVLAGACDEGGPSDPCSGDECGLPDLALSVTEIEWTDDQPIDERVGGRLVQPGDELTFRYRIVNRGDAASDSTLIWVGTAIRKGNLGDYDGERGRDIDVPPLEPGEFVTGRATLLSPAVHQLGFTRDVVAAQFRLYGFYSYPHPDADFTNNHTEYRYHLAAPVISVAPWYGDYEEPWRTGTSRVVGLTLKNHSAVATLSGVDAIFCMEHAVADRHPGPADRLYAPRRAESLPLDGV